MDICVCIRPTGTNEEKRGHQKDKDGKKQGEMETHPLPSLSLSSSLPLSPIQSWVWQNLAKEPENGHVSQEYGALS